MARPKKSAVPAAETKRQKTYKFYATLKSQRTAFNPAELSALFSAASRERVSELTGRLSAYIKKNLPAAFADKNALADYRTNPYVLMTSANIMKLRDPQLFARFLFDTKLYMALETSFGKSVEAELVSQYPLGSENKWIDAPEKLREFEILKHLSREEKAQARTNSVWREIDKSSIVGRTRYLTTIKSGPNCINDTQVDAMTRAISKHHSEWYEQTRSTYPGIEELDVVIGLTYGTDRTTNNKENQILVKLLERGFEEEDREGKAGVLIDSGTRRIRVYRRIGKDFWAFIGDPANPSAAPFVFLEVLLALAKALAVGLEEIDIEHKINLKLVQLAEGLRTLLLPERSLPAWVRAEFDTSQLFWFATAISAFYDEGI